MRSNRHRPNGSYSYSGSGALPDWAALNPVSIVALGAPAQPVERLIGLQSAVYRLIVMLGRRPRLCWMFPSIRIPGISARGDQPAIEPR
jgi:hypothetical protein